MSNRIQPRRNARTHTSYHEPDSSSASDGEVAHSTNRSLRLNRRVPSYRESSDEGSDFAVHVQEQSASTPAAETESRLRRTGNRSFRAPIARRSDDRSQPARPYTARYQKSFGGYKRRKLGQPRAVNFKSLAPSIPIAIPSSGRIPRWQSLEYQIWVDIMHYAAGPAHDFAGRGQVSIEWLLGMSRLCRNFHEAAISVLLWSPPLHSLEQSRRLLALLRFSQDSLSINYQNKIHALEIEVKQLLRKSGIDLESLLSQAPRLKHLRIFHRHDSWVGKYIWAEPSWGRDPWSYGNLFDVLDQNNIFLHSFEWNGRFRDIMSALLLSTHSPCMQSLQNLKFVNFVFEGREEEKRATVRDSLAGALQHWPQLRTLEFHNCNILDSFFVSQMPAGLHTLSISNCQSLTSGALNTYLSLAGGSLQKLYLSGNQVMDLGFAPDLKNSCQNLRNLHIDLSYKDSSSYQDRDPLYDDLLPNGRPSWPHELQSLVIGPLRSLSLADAEDFYQSLVDAADRLPLLRILSVKTILKDAGWRDRAKLRSKWSFILDEVFLSKRESVPLRVASIDQSGDGDKKDSGRKSVRIQEIGKLQAMEDAREHPAAADVNVKDLPSHNRCEVVEFDLSDQRPAQEQYREEDFLDGELSGDEEWKGD